MLKNSHRCMLGVRASALQCRHGGPNVSAKHATTLSSRTFATDKQGKRRFDRKNRNSIVRADRAEIDDFVGLKMSNNILLDEESEFLSSVVLSGDVSPHIQVHRGGAWVDTFDHKRFAKLDIPSHESGNWTDGPYIITKQQVATQEVIDHLPLNEECKTYLSRWADIYNTILNSSDPHLLKFIPLRDRLAFAIHRTNPRVLQHIMDFYHNSFSALNPYTEICNLPLDQGLYVQLIARFFGCSTKVTSVDNGVCSVVLFRIQNRLSHTLPTVTLKKEAVDLLSDFISNNKRAIEEVTAAHKLDLQAHYQSWLRLQNAESQACAALVTGERNIAAALASPSKGFEPSENFTVRILRPNEVKTPVYPVVKPHPNRPVTLPAFDAKDLFLHTIANNQVVMVIGPTGSGKSTQFPQFVYDWMQQMGDGGRCRIVMTQPRRLAAISLAHRVALEQGVPINSQYVRTGLESVNYNSLNMPVGYNVRQENYGNDFTNIRFVTTGVLLRRLMSRTLVMDPKDVLEQARYTPDMEEYWSARSSVLIQRVCQVLTYYTHIFIDEVHESSKDTDLLLAVIRDALPYLPHLRVVLMSATANATALAEYMGCNAIVDIQSRTFPIDVYHNKDVMRMVSSKPLATSSEREERVAKYLALMHQNGSPPDMKNKFVQDRLRAELLYEDHVLQEAEELSPLNDQDVVDKRILQLIKFITNNAASLEELAASKSRFSPTVTSQGNHRDSDANMVNNTISEVGAVGLLHSPADITQMVAHTTDEELNDAAWAFAYDALATLKKDTRPPPMQLTAPGVAAEKLPHGAILIFVPSWERIQTLTQLMLNDPVLSNPSRFALYQLHSTLPNEVQMRVFQTVPSGVTKIILGTNVAETSLTIPDVTHVIDVGLAKTKVYDSVNDVYNFTLEVAAKSNANQRKGRAGRTRPGVCYRMYSEDVYDQMVPQPRPEMLSMSIDSTVMVLKQFCNAPPQLAKLRDEGFKEVVYFMRRLISNVSDHNLSFAFRRLTNAHILDEKGKLTLLGFYASTLAMDIYTARVVVLSVLYGCLDAGLAAAAFLGQPDYICIDNTAPDAPAITARLNALSQGMQSDIMLAVNVYAAWCTAPDRLHFCREHGVNNQVLEQWTKTRIQTFLTLKKTPLGELVGPISITKGGRLVYNRNEEVLMHSKPSNADLMQFLSAFHDSPDAPFDSREAQVDVHDDANVSGLSNDGTFMHEVAVDERDEIITPDCIHLNDFPIDSNEWQLMVNQSLFPDDSADPNSTTAALLQTSKSEDPVASVSEADARNAHVELLRQDYLVGSVFTTGPVAPTPEQVEKCSTANPLPFPHANYAAAIPGLVEGVLHTAMYPNIGVHQSSRWMSRTGKLDMLVRLPPPNNKKNFLSQYSATNTDVVFPSPFVACSTTYKTSLGFVLKASGPVPPLALTLCPQTMTGTGQEKSVNEAIAAASHDYNAQRYKAVQDARRVLSGEIDAAVAGAEGDGSGCMSVEDLSDVWVTKGYQVLQAALPDGFPSALPVVCDEAPEAAPRDKTRIAEVVDVEHVVASAPVSRAFGMDTVAAMDKALYDLLWDADYDSEEQRRAHVERTGFACEEQQLAKALQPATHALSGFVGMHHKLPPANMVVAHIHNIFRTYRIHRSVHDDDGTDLPCLIEHLDVRKSANVFAFHPMRFQTHIPIFSPAARIFCHQLPLSATGDHRALSPAVSSVLQHLASVDALAEGRPTAITPSSLAAPRAHVAAAMAELVQFLARVRPDFRALALQPLTDDADKMSESLRASAAHARELLLSLEGLQEDERDFHMDVLAATELNRTVEAEIQNLLTGQNVQCVPSTASRYLSLEGASEGSGKTRDVISDQARQCNFARADAVEVLLAPSSSSARRRYHESTLLHYLHDYPLYHDRHGRDLHLAKRVLMVDQWLGFYSDPQSIRMLHDLRVLVNALQKRLFNGHFVSWRDRFLLFKALSVVSRLSTLQGAVTPQLDSSSKLDPLWLQQPSHFSASAPAGDAGHVHAQSVSPEGADPRALLHAEIRGTLESIMGVPPMREAQDIDFLRRQDSAVAEDHHVRLYSLPKLDHRLEYKAF